MSRWILAALLVAATAALMTSLLREESAASAHAEVLPGEVQGPRTIEDALVDRAPVESDPGLSSAAVPPAATVVLDAAMTGASDSAIKSLEDRLYLLELEDRIALADRAMIDQCEPLWGPYWSSGQYEVVESITADFMKDEQGRPRDERGEVPCRNGLARCLLQAQPAIPRPCSERRRVSTPGP